jgi:hypothetical protein
MGNGVLGSQLPGPTGASGEANLKMLAKTVDELRANAEVSKYPAYVRGAGGVKVLVADEAAHRELAPGDFDDDGEDAPARRGGRRKKADETSVE